MFAPASICGSTELPGIRKKSVKATTCLTEDQAKWVDEYVELVGMTTGDAKYGRSSVLSEAVEFFRRNVSMAYH